MSKVDQNSYGMMYNKKIFFNFTKTSSLIEKIKRILKRIGAEIVEQFDGDDCHVVITENINTNTDNRKRKSSTPIIHKFKKLRLNPDQQNDNPNSSSLHRNPSFINHAKKKGAKIKTVNEVLVWLNQFCKLLVEMDEPDDSKHENYILDKYCNVRTLQLPAMKILDPFGGTRPLFVEKYPIEIEMWYEFQRQYDSKIMTELIDKIKRTSLKKVVKKPRDLHNDRFCEVCREKYNNLYQHITKSESHARYAEDSTKYAELDTLLVPISDISLFFTNRESLLTRYKQTRQALISQVPRFLPVSSDNKDSKAVDQVVIDTLEIVNIVLPDQNESLSQSLSTSDSSLTSSDSSTSSSSHSSSSLIVESDTHLTEQWVSSTPVNNGTRVLPTSFFLSPDSVSADDCEQTEISFHVSSVIEHLDTMNDKNDQPDPTLFSLGSTSLSRSPIIEPRFKWCPSCHRNHIPWSLAIDISKEQEHKFHCQFSGIDTLTTANTNIDFEIIDLNIMMTNTSMESANIVTENINGNIQSNKIDVPEDLCFGKIKDGKALGIGEDHLIDNSKSVVIREEYSNYPVDIDEIDNENQNLPILSLEVEQINVSNHSNCNKLAESSHSSASLQTPCNSMTMITCDIESTNQVDIEKFNENSQLNMIDFPLALHATKLNDEMSPGIDEDLLIHNIEEVSALSSNSSSPDINIDVIDGENPLLSIVCVERINVLSPKESHPSDKQSNLSLESIDLQAHIYRNSSIGMMSLNHPQFVEFDKENLINTCSSDVHNQINSNREFIEKHSENNSVQSNSSSHLSCNDDDIECVNKHGIDGVDGENPLFPILSVCVERLNFPSSYNEDHPTDRQPNSSQESIGLQTYLDHDSTNGARTLDYIQQIVDSDKENLVRVNSSEILHQINLKQDFVVENKNENDSLQSNLSPNHDEIKNVHKQGMNGIVKVPGTSKTSIRHQINVSSDTKSPRRKCSIAANQGIINTNMYFTIPINNTIEALKNSYNPDVFDPREVMGALKYSKEAQKNYNSQTKSSSSSSGNKKKYVFRNRNL